MMSAMENSFTEYLTDIRCYICNIDIGDGTKISYNIFQEILNGSSSNNDIAATATTNGTLISTILERILKISITNEQIHSDNICEQCYDLCNEFNDISKRQMEIKTNLIHYYNMTIGKIHEEQVVAEVGEEQEEVEEHANVVEEHEHAEDEEEEEVLIMKNDSVENNPYLTDDLIETIVEADVDDVDEQTATEATFYSTETVTTTTTTTDEQNILLNAENKILFNVHPTNVIIGKNNISKTVTAAAAAVKNITNPNEYIIGTSPIHYTDEKYFDDPDTNMVEICTEDFDEFLHNNEQTIVTIMDKNELTANAVTDSSNLHHHHQMISIDGNVKQMKYDSIDTTTTTAAAADELNDDEMMNNDNDDNDNKSIKTKPIFLRNNSNFICQVCPSNVHRSFNLKSISNHFKIQHQHTVYICQVCGSDFRKRFELNVHMAEHVQEQETFHCDLCDHVCVNLRVYRAHKRMHAARSKVWTCDECDKRFSSKNLLDEHMNMHTGDRPYKCEKCFKDFASKYTLTAHMKIHTDRERPYKCSVCPKSFFSAQNLVQHERTHTGVKEFVCTECNKAFGTLHNLDVHKIVHTGYKPFICRTCGKAFARRAEIKDHERTHTGEKPYNCEICGASFAQRSNLMSHKRATHLNDKRYKCEQCDRSFKRRRLLDYHIRATHTGERPFECDTCGANFVYPEHFKKHLRIHTGDKPYKCEVCGKAFNSKDNRNAHRFVHSDKKPYECVYCGQGFMRKPQLLTHMEQRNHKNEVIILNHAQISTASMDSIVEQDEPNDEQDALIDDRVKSEHKMKYLMDDDDDDDDDDDVGDDEMIEEQYIVKEEDDTHLIVDDQVQYTAGSHRNQHIHRIGKNNDNDDDDDESGYVLGTEIPHDAFETQIIKEENDYE